jgi:hypothetical protein
MAAKRTTLATIWELPDPLWREIEPLLLEDAPPKATGRPRVDLRRVLDGIYLPPAKWLPMGQNSERIREEEHLAPVVPAWV